MLLVFLYTRKLMQYIITQPKAELPKYGYQLGFETLLVHTLNHEYPKFIFKIIFLLFTYKYFAWRVNPQGLNLKKLAGVCINGGACGLIR